MTQINLLFDSRPKKVFSAIEGKSSLENWKENQIFQVSVVMTFSLQKMIQNMYKTSLKCLKVAIYLKGQDCSQCGNMA